MEEVYLKRHAPPTTLFRMELSRDTFRFTDSDGPRIGGIRGRAAEILEEDIEFETDYPISQIDFCSKGGSTICTLINRAGEELEFGETINAIEAYLIACHGALGRDKFPLRFIAKAGSVDFSPSVNITWFDRSRSSHQEKVVDIAKVLFMACSGKASVIAGKCSWYESREGRACAHQFGPLGNYDGLYEHWMTAVETAWLWWRSNSTGSYRDTT